jgi:site-specific recombinase XerD
LGVTVREHINPALPDSRRLLVRLGNGGRNWYLRVREHGRYRTISLKTPDLTEARRQASLNPPDANPLHALSIKRALLAFQESRQQLLDAPGEGKRIRLNTFKTYKARIQTLIAFFDQQQVIKKEQRPKTVGSLCTADFAAYRSWRERKGLMPTTIKTEISEVNTILSWFYENQYIPQPIKVPLPRVNTDKYRQPNRLLSDEEASVLKDTLRRLSSTGDPERQKRWRLYGYWVQWLQDTFSRPHECRLLRLTDVREHQIEGKIAVQFYTRPETKTGQRLVYAASKVKGNLLRLYQSWGLLVTPESSLFLLPTGQPPSSTWFSDQWRTLVNECGFKVKPRELTQYSLRHQGINALLVQGVPPTKVADLAGHSLAIQQRIYKKYTLEDDHSVLRNDIIKQSIRKVNLSTDADLPEPWEIDPVTGEWFPDCY